MLNGERQLLRRRRDPAGGNIEKPSTVLRDKPKIGGCLRCLQSLDNWVWQCLFVIFLLVVVTVLLAFFIFTRVCPKLDTTGSSFFKFGGGQPFALQDEAYRSLVETGDWKEEPAGLSVAAIVSSQNNRDNIAEIVLPLKASGLIQTIVAIDDNFGNEDRPLWNDYLISKGHYTLRTNGVRQLSAYNMGSRLVTKGDMLLFLHDDDILPLNDHWISDALNLFGEYSELGILSGYGGEITNGMEFGEEPTASGSRTHRIPTVSTQTGVPFMWTVTAWAAPLFIRRSLFEDLNGFDEEMGEQRDLVIWFDEEFCLRAEKEKSMFSGIYPARGFKRSVGVKLVQLPFGKKVNALKRDREYLEKKYGSVWGVQAQKVRRKIMALDRRKGPPDAAEEYKRSFRVLSINI